jgi:tetratricopeptide (TPR) repeat protein
MTKTQIATILGSVILVFALYFGFDRVDPDQKSLEKSRMINIESTGIDNLVKEAGEKLDARQKSLIEAIQLDLSKTQDTVRKVELLKTLSGTWFDMGFPAISGYYAEEVAAIIKTEESWSMAGTTYALGVKNAADEKTREFCSGRAVKAFEKAISLAPDKIEPRLNLAICYTDNPPKDNPMQGILMMRELNAKYPENVGVLNQLGRLAIETNQTERALERLEKALSLEPGNNTTICLLAKAYQQAGKEALAKEFNNKCVD